MGFYPISVERASARIAFRKKIKQKSKNKKEMPIRYIGPIIDAHITMRKEKNWVGSQCFDVSFSAFRIIPKNISYPHRRSDFLYAYIITTNPNGSCLSSLGSISKISQNYRKIYSVKTFSCSRLHAKSKKSRFRIIPKKYF